MADEQARSRLGRGLAALIGDMGAEAVGEAGRGARRVPIAAVTPNPDNPRRAFDEVGLDELANSIRAKGVIQPIVVRAAKPAPEPRGHEPRALEPRALEGRGLEARGLEALAGPRVRAFDGDAPARRQAAERFEIIAGERRFRAAQRAGLREVPVVVIEASDRDVLEIAIVENVQRADLNAVEEAAGYQRLVDEHGYTQDDLARAVGKSRSHVANTLRLLRLPEPVKAWVREGALSAGHARALLAVPDPEAVGRRAIAEGLNVREIEAESARARDAEAAPGDDAPAPSARGRGPKDPDVAALEAALGEALGLPVSVNPKAGRARGGGELRIRYASLAQLNALCRRLGGGA